MMSKQKMLLAGLGLLLLVGLVGVATAGREFQVQYADSPEKAQSIRIATDTFEQLQDVASLDNNEKIPREIEMLVAKWSSTLMSGPGWLHVVNRYDRNRDQTGTLPNGKPVPLDYVSDTWYQLNDQGLATAVVAFTRDEDGQLQQVATFRDGTWRNLTFGDKYPGEAFAPQLDFGMGKYLQSRGSLVSRHEKAVDNRAIVVFTTQDAFVNPVAVAGYDKQAAQTEISVGFDLQTGQMLYHERVMTTPDGERQLVERVDILTVEKVSQLPDEALTFLNQEVTQ